MNITTDLPILMATLPLPPGINHSYQPVHRGIASTTELKTFKQAASFQLYMQKDMFDWIIIHGIQHNKQKIPLSVTIDFYHPTLWKRDIDGGEKAVIDAIFDCIGLNDNLIVDKHTRKMVDRNRPRCEIAVYLFEEEKK